MGYKPFFSIVMATYNRAYCIEKAINSVLNQSFKDWELIIVDDGSTDNTEEIIKKYLSNKKIKYIKLKKNSGVNVARNRAIKEVKGEYCLILDSDNELKSNILEKYTNYIKKENFPYMKFICENQNSKSTVANPNFYGFVSFKDFLSEKLKGEYQTLIKTDLLKNNLFFEDIQGGEGIVWKLMVKKTKKVLFIPEVAIIYNDENSDRLSIKNYNRLYKVFKKDLEVLGKDYLIYTPLMFFQNFSKLVIYGILKNFK